MATQHIQFAELTEDTKALLERVSLSGEVVIDREFGSGYRISPMRVGRTAAEALELIRNYPQAQVELDDAWANDLEAIIAGRRSERDPWTE